MPTKKVNKTPDLNEVAESLGTLSDDDREQLAALILAGRTEPKPVPEPEKYLEVSAGTVLVGDLPHLGRWATLLASLGASFTPVSNSGGDRLVVDEDVRVPDSRYRTVFGN